MRTLDFHGASSSGCKIPHFKTNSCHIVADCRYISPLYLIIHIYSIYIYYHICVYSIYHVWCLTDDISPSPTSAGDGTWGLRDLEELKRPMQAMGRREIRSDHRNRGHIEIVVAGVGLRSCAQCLVVRSKCQKLRSPMHSRLYMAILHIYTFYIVYDMQDIIYI